MVKLLDKLSTRQIMAVPHYNLACQNGYTTLIVRLALVRRSVSSNLARFMSGQISMNKPALTTQVWGSAQGTLGNPPPPPNGSYTLLQKEVVVLCHTGIPLCKFHFQKSHLQSVVASCGQKYEHNTYLSHSTMEFFNVVSHGTMQSKHYMQKTSYKVRLIECTKLI
jgi:hypothetical protein